jgi:hypothetical protein
MARPSRCPVGHVDHKHERYDEGDDGGCQRDQLGSCADPTWRGIGMDGRRFGTEFGLDRERGDRISKVEPSGSIPKLSSTCRSVSIPTHFAWIRIASGEVPVHTVVSHGGRLGWNRSPLMLWSVMIKRINIIVLEPQTESVSTSSEELVRQVSIGGRPPVPRAGRP